MESCKILLLFWLVVISILVLSQAEDSTTVTVRFGYSIHPNDIEEGDDVYFDCLVNSSSPVTKIEWKHNDVYLRQNQSRGILTSNVSLVLQALRVDQRGEYKCEATEGGATTESPPLVLNIKFIPVCANSEPSVHRVAEGETVMLNCSLNSNPAPADFSWTFNSSNEVHTEIHQTHSKEHGHYSIYTFQPLSQANYGTVMCWGANEIGRQRRPCSFQILPPEEIFLMEDSSQTIAEGETAHLACRIGKDGDNPKTEVIWIRRSSSGDTRIAVTFPDGLTVLEEDGETMTAYYDSGEKSFDLTIRLVKKQDAGEYVCQVNKDGQQHERTVTLNIEGPEPLSFKTHNATTVRVAAGEMAVLPCEFSGNISNYSVSWIRRKDLHILSVDSYTFTPDDRFSTDYKRAEKSWALKIRYIQPRDSGLYECQLSTTPRMSMFTDLQVYEPESDQPSFKSPNPITMRVNEGSTAILPCTVNNLGSYKVAWLLQSDHSVLTVGLRRISIYSKFDVQHDSSQNSWNLVIKNVSTREADTYNCKVNTNPMMEKSITLEIEPVNERPSFRASTDITVKAVEGSKAILPCEVDNLGIHTVAWSQLGSLAVLTFGTNIETDDRRFDIQHNSSQSSWNLVIDDVSGSDAGTYVCQVDTIPRMRKNIFLEIKTSKRSIKVEVVKRVEVGDTVELTCDIDTPGGVPPVYVFWYHEGEMLNQSEDTIIQIDNQGKTSKLSILDAKAEHSGNYTCSASNAPSSSVVVRVG